MIFSAFNYVESKAQEGKHWFVTTSPRPLPDALIEKGLKIKMTSDD